MVELLCTDDAKKAMLLPGGGFARIFGPDGQMLHEPLAEDAEGLVYADLDLGMISLAKAAADPAGHYARPDVTRLLLNKTPGDRVVSFSAPGVEIEGEVELREPGIVAESAIPPHLTVERTRPRRVPDDYAPPYPSFVARNAPEVSQVVMAYFGLQPAGEPAVARRPRRRAGGRGRTGAPRPGHAATARSSPPPYWVDPDTFDRWWAAHRDSWLGDGVRDGHGRWAEIVRPRVEEHETLFSSLGRPEGVAVLAEGMSGEVVEHAYWGGMRDRIPLSQTDPMLGLGAPARRGGRPAACASGRPRASA